MDSLKNKTIFLSREKNKAKLFIDELDNLGANVIPVPLTTFEHWKIKENKTLLDHISKYDWIIFTSINGVHFFFQTLKEFGYTISILKQNKALRFGTVGTKTELALKQYGFNASFVPTTFDADHFSSQYLQKYKPNYPLLVKGNLARDVIDRELSKENIPFDTMFVYKTAVNDKINLVQILKEYPIDLYCFTSPSSIDAFSTQLKGNIADELNKPCFCIGETTEAKAKEVGFKHTLIPNEYTLDGLLEKIIESSERGIV